MKKYYYKLFPLLLFALREFRVEFSSFFFSNEQKARKCYIIIVSLLLVPWISKIIFLHFSPDSNWLRFREIEIRLSDFTWKLKASNSMKISVYVYCLKTILENPRCNLFPVIAILQYLQDLFLKYILFLLNLIFN